MSTNTDTATDKPGLFRRLVHCILYGSSSRTSSADTSVVTATDTSTKDTLSKARESDTTTVGVPPIRVAAATTVAFMHM